MKLDPDDIEQIATRVAAALRDEIAPPEHAARLVDAATVARRLGVERNWVYAHADQLGAIRLDGRQGRLRFDLLVLRERLRTPAEPPAAQPPPRRRRGPSGPVELLAYPIESRYLKSGRATQQRPRPDTGRLGPDA